MKRLLIKFILLKESLKERKEIKTILGKVLKEYSKYKPKCKVEMVDDKRRYILCIYANNSEYQIKFDLNTSYEEQIYLLPKIIKYLVSQTKELVWGI